MSNDRDALNQRDAILSAVGFVTSELLQSSDWRSSIDVVLSRLGQAVQANRAYYFELHESPDGVELCSQRAEWTADSIQPQLKNPDLQNIPMIAAGMERWLRWMKEHRPVYGLIADFPESERAILEAQQIQSLIVMPVFVQNTLAGFIGFDDCETLREWSLAETDALLAATTALGAGMERQALETQLRFAQKMEAIGRLAAGVAHDFNNMLHAISAFTTVAKLKIDSGNDAQQDLNEVLTATEQANHLTRQLLTFSRKQETAPSNIDLNDLCGRVLSMVRPVLGSAIELSENLPADPPIIFADAGLINQILLNLCLNARDAISGPGQIDFVLERRKLTPKEQQDFDASVAEDDYAVISVIDSGTGMKAGLRDQIFEPFFTTKEVGQGTGLGLSVAYGAVRQSGGHINVHSEPGKGSQFDVFLPTVLTSVSSRPSQAVVSGSETILLVDDDPLVLASSKALIKSMGYRVWSAVDGLEGLQVYKEHADEIDLVVTDTRMPRMNGFDFRDAILSVDSQAKVIMVSGYAPDLSSVEVTQPDRLVLLTKPVCQESLSTSIREMLDSKKSNA